MCYHFYLLLTNINQSKIGSIVEYGDDEIEIISKDFTKQIVKLSINEAFFYHKHDRNDRIAHYRAGLYDKIENLQINNICQMKIQEKIVTVRILKKDYKTVTQLFVSEDSDESIREIPVSMITDVAGVSNIQKELKTAPVSLSNPATQGSSDHGQRDKPFKTREIPDEKRIFPELNIKSAVKYYYETVDDVTDLFGTLRWTGCNEAGEYLYGIELDDTIPNGTDGEFLGQRLFSCPFGHGILASLYSVATDTRFTDQVVKPEDMTMSTKSTERFLGILTRLDEGQNKGIQGNANSYYFDSAIFALFVNSDVLDFMISPKLKEKEKNDITKKFRDVMAWEIVYPLRENQFVSFHGIAEMRNIIQKYGTKFVEMMKHESDMKNVFSVLSMLCPTEQLLSIVSFNQAETKSMFMQLYLTLGKKVKYMTSEEMLKISMVQNNIMFNELPSCLIFEAPRDATGRNVYEFVIPSKSIEISELCVSHFRKCSKCSKKAIFQCKNCMERNNLEISSGLTCDSHKCHHKDRANIPDFSNLSKSKVFFNLQAIICIEKCHCVAYVNDRDKWFFFDSMSTRSLSNGYAIPRITYSKEVTDFLNMSDTEKQEFYELFCTEPLKSVLKDSYVFVYHNSTRTCY